MPKGRVKNAWVNSPQADAVAEYYVQGHSVTKTAERFGVSKAQVNNLAKTRRLTNGRQFQKARVDDQKKEAEQRLAKHLTEIGFDYVGGYTDKDGKVKIRCKQCGSEFERTIDHLYRGNVICPECQKREVQKRQAAKKQLEKERAEIRQIERTWRMALHQPKDPYKEQHEAFLNRDGVCEICGKPYTVREYVESCGLRKASDNGVCSQECANVKHRRLGRTWKKINGYKDGHRHRAKKYGCAYDSSVTLQKLIERDGLRCAICGKMCDPNDHSWSEYCGPMYPSIDHIIPMSKGGGHVWDNVQIAHIICNSEKGDTIQDVAS